MSTPPTEVWFPAVPKSGGMLIRLSVQVIEGMKQYNFPEGRLSREGPRIISRARNGANHAPADWLNPYIKVKFSELKGWSGDSYGLALVIADILACLKIPATAPIYATGIIGEDGSINAVGEQILGEKLKLLTDIPAGSRFFYPAVDAGEQAEVTLEALRNRGIQTHGVGHVDEVLELLGSTDIELEPEPPPTPAQVAEFQVSGLPGITRLYLASAHNPITLGRAAPVGGPMLPLHCATDGLSREHLRITHRQGQWLIDDPRPGDVGTLLTRVAGVELLREGPGTILKDGDGVAILQQRLRFSVRLDQHWLCFDVGATRYLLINGPVVLGTGCLPLPEIASRSVGLAHRHGGFVLTADDHSRPCGLQRGVPWQLGRVRFHWPE